MEKINKYTIAIDKLKFQCVGGFKPVDAFLNKGKLLKERTKIKVNDRIRIARIKNETDIGFDYTFSVFIDDFICGTISYQTNGEYKYKIKNGLTLFTCKNEFLYTENFNMELDYIVKALEIHILKIDLIEFACDGHGIIDTANELLNVGNKGIWSPLNKKHMLKIQTENLQNGFSRKITFGDSKSKKYFVFYPKSEELKKKQNKKHIIEYWSSAGLDLNLPIDRAELSIKSSRHLSGFSLNPSDWSRAYLAAFYKDRAEKYFLYKNKKGEKKSIIQFSFLKPDAVYFSRRVYNSKNNLFSIRCAIKVLYQEIGCYPCGATYEILIKKYHLQTWFNKMRKRW